MSRYRGQQMSGLPKLHAAGSDGKALCKPKPRKWGHVMAQRPDEADCKLCRRRLGLILTSADGSAV